jgi:hypothetical protein
MTRGGLIIVTSGVALTRALALTLAREVDNVVIVSAEDVGPVEKRAPPSLEDALARVKVRDYAVQAERAAYHDERRGDPQRDVAMLRREMLARERSQRHMLKKGRGRR